MLHIMEDVWLLDTEGVRTGSTTTRIAIPGGWLYTGGQVAQFVPDPTAAHVRDSRRLKLREGGTQNTHGDEDRWVTVWRDPNGFAAIVRHSAHSFTAIHADGSETDHPSRLEAHDALVESGSPSPFEVVVGPAVKP